MFNTAQGLQKIIGTKLKFIIEPQQRIQILVRLLKYKGGTYYNEQYKIYKIVERVSIHDIVHDVHPSFQRDDLVVAKKGQRERRHII